jgi:hypothetical protein
MTELSALWKWVERAAAWDLDQRQKKLKRMLQEREDMDRRQAQVGEGLQAIGMMSAMRHREKMMKDPDRALTPQDTTHMIETGVKIERQARTKEADARRKEEEAPATLEAAFRWMNSGGGNHNGNGSGALQLGPGADGGGEAGDDAGDMGPRVLPPPPEPA